MLATLVNYVCLDLIHLARDVPHREDRRRGEEREKHVIDDLMGVTSLGVRLFQ